MTFKVTGLTMKGSQPNQNGTTIQAFFDAHNSEIGFKGCALAQKKDGGWVVWPPKLEGGAGRKFGDRLAVYFRKGSRIREELLEAALASYRALNGAPDDDEPGALGEELAEEIAE